MDWREFLQLLAGGLIAVYVALLVLKRVGGAAARYIVGRCGGLLLRWLLLPGFQCSLTADGWDLVNASLRPDLMELASLFNIKQLSVRLLRLRWSFTGFMLTVTVEGIQLELQQKLMPKASNELGIRQYAAVLDDLEGILWNGLPTQHHWWEKSKFSVLRVLVCLAIKHFRLQVHDVRVLVSQMGFCGPQAPTIVARCRPRDGILLHVRTFNLEPDNLSLTSNSVYEQVSATWAWKPKWHERGRVPVRTTCSLKGVSVTLLTNVRGPSQLGSTGVLAQTYDRMGNTEGLPYTHMSVKPFEDVDGTSPASSKQRVDAQPGQPTTLSQSDIAANWSQTFLLFQQWGLRAAIACGHPSMLSDNSFQKGRFVDPCNAGLGQQTGGGTNRTMGSIGQDKRQLPGKPQPSTALHVFFDLNTDSKYDRDRDVFAHLASPGGGRGDDRGSTADSLRSSDNREWMGAESSMIDDLRKASAMSKGSQGGEHSSGNVNTGGNTTGKVEEAKSAEKGVSERRMEVMAVRGSVEVRALVPQVCPEGLAVLTRMIDQISEYSRFEPYWRNRPSMSVVQSPVAWWQHVGNAVLTGVRQHVMLKQMRHALERRRRYIDLCVAIYDPKKRKLFSASQALGQRTQMDDCMTVWEIIMFRLMAALQHSKPLMANPTLRSRLKRAIVTWRTALHVTPFLTTAVRELSVYSPVTCCFDATCPSVGLQLLSAAGSKGSQTGLNSQRPGTGRAGGSVERRDLRSSHSADVASRALLLLQATDCSVKVSDAGQLHLVLGSVVISKHDDGSGEPPQYLLKMPMDSKHRSIFREKFDFSAPGAYNATTGRHGIGWVYPPAELCRFMPSVHVFIQPFEVVFEPDLIMQLLDFTTQHSMVDKCRESTATNSEESLQTLVLHRLQYKDKQFLHYSMPCSFFCPLAALRVPMRAAAAAKSHLPPVLQTVPGSCCRAKYDLLLYISQVGAQLEYQDSCYDTLLQQSNLNFQSVEVVFQQMPHTCNQDHVARYAQLWIHPDDVMLLFGEEGYATAAAGKAVSIMTAQRPMASRWNRLRNSFSKAKSFMNVPGAQPAVRQGSFSRPKNGITWACQQRRHLHWPFIPVAKLDRTVTNVSSSVPEGPNLQGQDKQVVSVHTNGMVAWVCSWQMHLALALMDQVQEDLSQLKASAVATSSTAGDQASEAGDSDGAGTLTPNTAMHHALIVRVQTLTVLCFAEVPLTTLENGKAQHQARHHQPVFTVHPMPWVLKRLGTQPNGSTPPTSDPLLVWGLHISPMLGVNVVDTSISAVEVPGQNLNAHLTLGGLLVRNLLLPLQVTVPAAGSSRPKGPDPAGVPPNASGSDPVTQSVTATRASFLFESPPPSKAQSSSQTVQVINQDAFIITPLGTRTQDASATSAEVRLRMMNVSWGYMTHESDRRTLIRIRWRRLLEERLMGRQVDYAMFLLCNKHMEFLRLHPFASSALQLYSDTYKASLQNTHHEVTHIPLSSPLSIDPTHLAGAESDGHPVKTSFQTPTGTWGDLGGRAGAPDALHTRRASSVENPIGLAGAHSMDLPTLNLRRTSTFGNEMLRILSLNSSQQEILHRADSADYVDSPGGMRDDDDHLPAPPLSLLYTRVMEWSKLDFNRAFRSIKLEGVGMMALMQFQMPCVTVMFAPKELVQLYSGHTLNPLLHHVQRQLWVQLGQFNIRLGFHSLSIMVDLAVSYQKAINSSLESPFAEGPPGTGVPPTYPADEGPSFIGGAQWHGQPDGVTQEQPPAVAVVPSELAWLVVVKGIHLTCMLEPMPRTQKAALTQSSSQDVFSVRLNNTWMNFAITQAPRAGSDVVTAVHDVGILMEMAVSDLTILDLQACEEHTLVLAANQHGNPILKNALRGSGKKPNCQMHLRCFVPYTPGQSLQVVLNIDNPRLLTLRRFVQNLLYGINLAMSVPSQANSAQQHQTASSSPQQSEEQAPMLFMVQARNVQLVVPASAKSMHLQRNLALHKEALCLNSDHIRVSMPAGACPLLQQTGHPYLFEDFLRMHDMDPDDGAEWISGADVGEMIDVSMNIEETAFPSPVPEIPAPSAAERPFHHAAMAAQGPAQTTHATPSFISQTTNISPNPASLQHRTPARPIQYQQSYSSPQSSQLYDGSRGGDNTAVVVPPTEELLNRISATQSTNLMNSATFQQFHQSLTPPGAEQMSETTNNTKPKGAVGFRASISQPSPYTQTPARTSTNIDHHQLPDFYADSSQGDACSTKLATVYSSNVMPGDHGNKPPGCRSKDASAYLFVQVHDMEVRCCVLQAVKKEAAESLDSPSTSNVQPAELTEQLQILGHTSMEVVLFPNPATEATQVHIMFADTFGILCATRYAHIINVCTQNFLEYRSSFEPEPEHTPYDSSHCQTHFDPNLRFGPDPTDSPYFMLTVVLPHFHVNLENHPGWWSADTSVLKASNVFHKVPFVKATLEHATLSLRCLERNSDLHLDVSAHEVQVYDLRLHDVLTSQNASIPSEWAETMHSSLQSSMHMTGDLNAHSGDKQNRSHYVEPPADHQMAYQSLLKSISALQEQPAPVLPVLDVLTIQGELVPVVRLIQSFAATDEFLHGDDTEESKMPPPAMEQELEDIVRLKVTFSYLSDGTMVNEVQLNQLAVTWPFLTDMSLVNAVVSIFVPTWGLPADLFSWPQQVQAYPWLYFNLVLHKSQLYFPLISPHLAGRSHMDDLDSYGFEDLMGTGSVAHDPISGNHLFSTICRVLTSKLENVTSTCQQFLYTVPNFNLQTTRQAGVETMQSLQSSLTTTTTALENLGIDVKMRELRFGYFFGGDGETRMKVDLRWLSMFVRHPDAWVTCLLLPPQSISFDWESSIPIVEENKLWQQQVRAAVVLKAAWKQYMEKKKKAVNQRAARKLEESMTARSPVASTKPSISDVDTDTDGGRVKRTPEEILIASAEQHLKQLLSENNIQTGHLDEEQVQAAVRVYRRPARSNIFVHLHPITVRAAFSHTQFYQALLEDVHQVNEHAKVQPNMFEPASIAFQIAKQQKAKDPYQVKRSIDAALPPEFRQSLGSVRVELQSVSLVLCDDKPNSFGAPDVLQVTLENVDERTFLQYDSDYRLEGHAPDQQGVLDLRLSSMFMNNSSSRWESLVEPWPVRVVLSDPVNSVFKQNRTKWLWLLSPGHPLKMNFHPACLLSIGDALAFMSQLQNYSPIVTRDTPSVTRREEQPPPMSEQMALTSAITSRVPQRYLIHNQTSLTVWYSSGEEGRRNKNLFCLPHGHSEELKVAPTIRMVKEVEKGGTVRRRLVASVICLQFPGSWMPIKQVAVDNVGKYKYYLYSPHNNVRIPIVVDVVLVGRTKILKLHSAVWVENATDKPLELRLQLPNNMLTQHIAHGPKESFSPLTNDLLLYPLRSGQGRYLPVPAVFGGLLYIKTPGYLEARHHPITLSPDLHDIKKQEGYVRCDAQLMPTNTRSSIDMEESDEKGFNTMASTYLVFAVQVVEDFTRDINRATQTLRESAQPGLFAKADGQMEVAIKIAPTIQVVNSLPFFMHVMLMPSDSSQRVLLTGIENEAGLPPGAVRKFYISLSNDLHLVADIPQLNMASVKGGTLINHRKVPVSYGPLEYPDVLKLEHRSDDLVAVSKLSSYTAGSPFREAITRKIMGVVRASVGQDSPDVEEETPTTEGHDKSPRRSTEAAPHNPINPLKLFKVRTAKPRADTTPQGSTPVSHNPTPKSTPDHFPRWSPFTSKAPRHTKQSASADSLPPLGKSSPDVPAAETPTATDNGHVSGEESDDDPRYLVSRSLRAGQDSKPPITYPIRRPSAGPDLHIKVPRRWSLSPRKLASPRKSADNPKSVDPKKSVDAQTPLDGPDSSVGAPPEQPNAESANPVVPRMFRKAKAQNVRFSLARASATEPLVQAATPQNNTSAAVVPTPSDLGMEHSPMPPMPPPAGSHTLGEIHPAATNGSHSSEDGSYRQNDTTYGWLAANMEPQPETRQARLEDGNLPHTLVGSVGPDSNAGASPPPALVVEFGPGNRTHSSASSASIAFSQPLPYDTPRFATPEEDLPSLDHVFKMQATIPAASHAASVDTASHSNVTDYSNVIHHSDVIGHSNVTGHGPHTTGLDPIRETAHGLEGAVSTGVLEHEHTLSSLPVEGLAPASCPPTALVQQQVSVPSRAIATPNHDMHQRVVSLPPGSSDVPGLSVAAPTMHAGVSTDMHASAHQNSPFVQSTSLSHASASDSVLLGAGSAAVASLGIAAPTTHASAGTDVYAPAQQNSPFVRSISLSHASASDSVSSGAGSAAVASLGVAAPTTHAGADTDVYASAQQNSPFIQSTSLSHASAFDGMSLGAGSAAVASLGVAAPTTHAGASADVYAPANEGSPFVRSTSLNHTPASDGLSSGAACNSASTAVSSTRAGASIVHPGAGAYVHPPACPISPFAQATSLDHAAAPDGLSLGDNSAGSAAASSAGSRAPITQTGASTDVHAPTHQIPPPVGVPPLNHAASSGRLSRLADQLLADFAVKSGMRPTPGGLPRVQTSDDSHSASHGPVSEALEQAPARAIHVVGGMAPDMSSRASASTVRTVGAAAAHATMASAGGEGWLAGDQVQHGNTRNTVLAQAAENQPSSNSSDTSVSARLVGLWQQHNATTSLSGPSTNDTDAMIRDAHVVADTNTGRVSYYQNWLDMELSNVESLMGGEGLQQSSGSFSAVHTNTQTAYHSLDLGRSADRGIHGRHFPAFHGDEAHQRSGGPVAEARENEHQYEGIEASSPLWGSPVAACSTSGDTASPHPQSAKSDPAPTAANSPTVGASEQPIAQRSSTMKKTEWTRSDTARRKDWGRSDTMHTGVSTKQDADKKADNYLAPRSLYLGITNSFARDNDAVTCEVCVHAHYWIQNLTGMNLTAVDAHSEIRYLLGDATEVFCPGDRSDLLQQPNKKGTTKHKQHTTVALFNQSPSMLLRLPENRFITTKRINIATLGVKSKVDLKGPIITPPPTFKRCLGDPVSGEASPSGPSLAKSQSSGLMRMPSRTAAAAAKRKAYMQQHPVGMGPTGLLYFENDGRPPSRSASTSSTEQSEPRPAAEREGASGSTCSKPKEAQIQRLFTFAVSVWAAPADSIFRATKIVSIKNKYTVQNDTGYYIEIKQVNTPDAYIPKYGVGKRFARVLQPGTRCALHWDNSSLPQEMQMRLVPTTQAGNPVVGLKKNKWEWSGSLAVAEREEYFGLRIRHQQDPQRDQIIPVNITVGTSNNVLVTFKSSKSVPPYRIENRCKDVDIRLCQVKRQWYTEEEGSFIHNIIAKSEGSTPVPEEASMAAHDVHWDVVPPNRSIPFAWDQPTWKHVLRVQAKDRKAGDHAWPTQMDEQSRQSHDVDIDTFKEEIILHVTGLKYKGGPAAGLSQPRAQENLELQENRQVYVTTYADGPTRVLVFAQERNFSTEDENSLVNLNYRLQQVRAGLRQIGGQPKGAGGSASPRKGRAQSSQQLSSDHLSDISASTNTYGTVYASTILGQSQKDSGGRSSPLSSAQSAGREVKVVGGDVKVSIMQARALKMTNRGAFAYVRVTIIDPGGRKQTAYSNSNMDSPGSPMWNFEEVFSNVLALGQLVIEVLEVDSSTKTGPPVNKESRKLGQVDIPLQSTANWKEKGGTTRWLPLRRSSGQQAAEGDVEVKVEWQDGGVKGQLQVEVALMESLLSQRLEMLALQNPIPHTVVAEWLKKTKNSDQDQRRATGADGASFHNGLSGMTLQAPRIMDMSASDINSQVLMLKRMREVYFVNLDVEVLEARNLPHRGGWNSKLSRMLTSTSANSVVEVSNQLPMATVEVSYGPQANAVESNQHSLNPRFPAKKYPFVNVTQGGHLQIQVFDTKKLLGTRPFAHAVLPVTTILALDAVQKQQLRQATPQPSNTGTDPLYMWLPLQVHDTKPAMRTGGALPAGEQDTQPPTLFLRVQITRPPRHDAQTYVEVDIAGFSFLARSGVFDELLNFTVDSVEVQMQATSSEVCLHGAISALQLDNQLLSARQPVVLAPTGTRTVDDKNTREHMRSATRRRMRGAFDKKVEDAEISSNILSPLIRFSLVQTFSNKNPSLDSSSKLKGNTTRNMKRHDTISMPERLTQQLSILSFKKVALEVGPLDLRTDETFVDALLLYLSGLPMDDVWQDQKWQERNSKLQGLQVTGAASGAPAPLDRSKALTRDSLRDSANHQELQWFLLREQQEITAMQAQSSTWYFFEELKIGDFRVNVTVALSNRVAAGIGGDAPAGGLGPHTEQQPRGMLNMLGYQLINVSNVFIHLKGPTLANRLMNRNALVNFMVRHYFWQGVSEARKIVGGAGPEWAQIPAALIWAGFSMVDLTRDLAARRVHVAHVAPRVGFMVLTVASSVMGFVSRVLMLMMASTPVMRDDALSDTETLQRFLRRPNNALEAFAEAWEEVVKGFVAAGMGVVLDPLQGGRRRGLQGAAGVAIGTVKGVAGLVVRPVAGMAEGLSKNLQGLALICLGRQGIQGSLQRRVRVPGSSLVDAASAAQQQSRQQVAEHKQLLEAWQASLGSLSPDIGTDVAMDVVGIDFNKVLLLTNKHIVYLKARNPNTNAVTYRLKWIVSNASVQNVRGSEGLRRILIEHSRVVGRGHMSMTLPSIHSLTCPNADVYQQVIMRVNTHVAGVRMSPSDTMKAASNQKDVTPPQLTLLLPQSDRGST